MGFFITDAMADAATTSATPPDSTYSLVMIAVIFVLFYFMLIRPQNKRAKEHRQLVAELKKGDEIVTSGGILGKIAHIDEQFIRLEVASGVEITIQRSSVGAVLPKGTLKTKQG